jgi:hypothetical protein
VTAAGYEELRDRLTRGHLIATGEAAQPDDVRTFRRRWWDGGAHVPAVVVQLDDSSRCRLVETGGRVVALPARGWRARRAIRRLRRPPVVDRRLLALARRQPDPLAASTSRVAIVRQRSEDLPLGQPTVPQSRFDRPRPVVRIAQEADVVHCGSSRCSALIPIPPPGGLITETTCPRCGRVALPTPRSLELAGQSR